MKTCFWTRICNAFCTDFNCYFVIYPTRQSFSIKQICETLHFTTAVCLNHKNGKDKLKQKYHQHDLINLKSKEMPFSNSDSFVTKIIQTSLPAKTSAVQEIWLKLEDTGQHPPTQTSIYITGPFRDEQPNFWQEVTHKWFKFLRTPLRERKRQCWQPQRVVNRHFSLFIKKFTHTVTECRRVKHKTCTELFLHFLSLN